MSFEELRVLLFSRGLQVQTLEAFEPDPAIFESMSTTTKFRERSFARRFVVVVVVIVVVVVVVA